MGCFTATSISFFHFVPWALGKVWNSSNTSALRSEISFLQMMSLGLCWIDLDSYDASQIHTVILGSQWSETLPIPNALEVRTSKCQHSVGCVSLLHNDLANLSWEWLQIYVIETPCQSVKRHIPSAWVRWQRAMDRKRHPKKLSKLLGLCVEVLRAWRWEHGTENAVGDCCGTLSWGRFVSRFKFVRNSVHCSEYFMIFYYFSRQGCTQLYTLNSAEVWSGLWRCPELTHGIRGDSTVMSFSYTEAIQQENAMQIMVGLFSALIYLFLIR